MAFVTVVTQILSVNAQTFVTVVAFVVFILAIGTSAKYLFAQVAYVVFVLVKALADYGLAYVAEMVKIAVGATF